MRKRSISDRTVSEEKSTASGRKKKNVLTADAMFYLLMEYEENKIIRLEQEFRRDDHHFWYTPQNRSGMASHQKEWEEMRRKMQTEIELFQKKRQVILRDLWSICRQRTGSVMTTGSFCGSFRF